MSCYPMNSIKASYYKACSVLPMSLIKSVNSAGTLLPYHHTVSNDFLPHIKHLYNYKNEKQFTNDIDFLLKHYNPISTDDFKKCVIENSVLPKKSFLLSFDDGLKEIYEIIAPILLKKGVPAYFFINPSFINNKELFYRYKVSLLINEILKNKEQVYFLNIFYDRLGIKNKNFYEIIKSLKNIDNKNAYLLEIIAGKIGFSFNDFLLSKQPFLTEEQLKLLHIKGFTLGGHSMDHPHYYNLSLSEQVEQTIASCKYVNEILGINNCSFSFPHSDEGISQEFFNIMKDYNIPLYFGTQNQKMEIKNKMLHRFNAERPEIDFSSQIKGLTTMIWFKNLIGTNKIVR